MHGQSWKKWTGLLLLATFPVSADHHLAGEKMNGQRGPGLGNLSYSEDELWEPISFIDTKNGHGTMVMHRGYLVVLHAPDSGKKGGGLSFWDLSDPRNPKMVLNRKDTQTEPMREPHAWGIWKKAEKYYAAVQTIEGVMIWDWTDMANPEIVSNVKLKGVKASDYDWGAWWTAIQGDIVYVAGSMNGFYVLDMSDVKEVKIMNHIPVEQAGGFRVNCIFAVGNLLVTTNANDNNKGFATYDISDPANPVLLDVLKQQVGYSSLVNGNRIYGVDEELGVYDINDPTDINHLGKSKKIGGKGGYATIQDGFVFAGASKQAAKIDVHDTENFKIVGTGSSNISKRDEDFASVIGNIMIAGDDHGQKSAIIPHQQTPDKKGPVVNMIIPKEGTVNQALSSRIGVTFTDNVELETVNSETFIVRESDQYGEKITGVFSVQGAIVNFRPDQPLKINTTYDVILKRNGVKDYNNNGLEHEWVSRFSTGETISEKAVRLKSGNTELRMFPFAMERFLIKGNHVIMYSEFQGINAKGQTVKLRNGR